MITRTFVALLLTSTSLTALAEPYPETYPPPAAAGHARGALRAACGDDVARFCPGAKPGSGQIKECLKAHRNELSPECIDAVRQWRQAKAGANGQDDMGAARSTAPYMPSPPEEQAPSLFMDND